jgi:predicted metal-binding membrane protein
MAGLRLAVWRAQGRDIRRELLRRPEVGAVAVVLSAWLVLVVFGDAYQGLLHVHAGRSIDPHSQHADMDGMNMPEHHPTTGEATTASLLGAALGSGAWVLMTIAMMGPAAMSGVRHTRLNSLRRRQTVAIAEYAAGYLAPWWVFGLILLALLRLPGWTPSWGAAAVTLAIAALWQLTPWKRRCLRECHRSIPLPPSGWRADYASIRFGLRNGVWCVGSCWTLMTVMVAVAGAHLWWTLALTVVVTAERVIPRPRRATRATAVGLSITAAASAVATLA